MNARRIGAAALAAGLAVGLSACGSDDSGSGGGGSIKIGIKFDQPGLGQKVGSDYKGFDVDVLDVEFDVAERDVGAHVELEEVEDLGLERDAGPQVVDLEVDLPHVERRNVQQDVRLTAVGGTHRGVGLDEFPFGDLLAVE